MFYVEKSDVKFFQINNLRVLKINGELVEFGITILASFKIKNLNTS